MLFFNFYAIIKPHTSRLDMYNEYDPENIFSIENDFNEDSYIMNESLYDLDDDEDEYRDSQDYMDLAYRHYA